MVDESLIKERHPVEIVKSPALRVDHIRAPQSRMLIAMRLVCQIINENISLYTLYTCYMHANNDTSERPASKSCSCCNTITG